MGWIERIGKFRPVAVVAIAVSLMLAGCSGGDDSSDDSSTSGDEVVIGALYMNEQGFYGGVKKGIEDGAADQNIRLLGNNSAGDASKEAQFMSQLIGAQVDVIIMSPVSETGSVSVVKQAYDAGIPVICYNTCIEAEAAEQYVSALVTTDDDEFGRLAGNAAADYFEAAGVADPKFGLLQCDSFEQCQRRKEGFLAALEERLPDSEIVADQEAYDADKATSVGTNVLTSNSEIDALWSANEGGTIGAVQAVKQANKTDDVAVFGSDIDTQLAEFLQDGSVLKATVGQAPQEIGKQAVQIGLDVVAGEEVETYRQIVPVTLYSVEDQEAVSQWLEDHADGLP